MVFLVSDLMRTELIDINKIENKTKNPIISENSTDNSLNFNDLVEF